MSSSFTTVEGIQNLILEGLQNNPAINNQVTNMIVQTVENDLTISDDQSSTGFTLISSTTTTNDYKLKTIRGDNVNIQVDPVSTGDLLISYIGSGGSGVNSVENDINGTGISLISGASTPADIKLKTIIGLGNQINQIGSGDIEIENLIKIQDADNITGQSLIESQSGYETFLKSIKAGAGISVSTIADDIVISGAGAIYNPANEIYIDASYTGTEAGTASEPFITLDSAITHLNTLPLGNYVFIFNQGNYSTALTWNYPMGDGFTTTKSLSMVGKVANGCVITSDINFIGIALEPANFQINAIALVGALCTMDFSAHTSGEFNSVTITNGFINNLDYTGPPFGNPSLIGYIRAGVGTITCLSNGPTLQNAFLIGNINLTTANSRITINSCSNVNCTLTLSNGSIANISGLVSTTNPNWLVSGDANMNIFYLDVWTGSLSTLIGDLTLAKCIIDKELIAGTNITITQDAQGQTTIDATGGGGGSLDSLSDAFNQSSNRIFLGNKPTNPLDIGNNTIVISENGLSSATSGNYQNIFIGSASSSLTTGFDNNIIGWNNVGSITNNLGLMIFGNNNFNNMGAGCNYNIAIGDNNNFSGPATFSNFNIMIGQNSTLDPTKSGQIVFGYNTIGCGVDYSLTMPFLASPASPSSVIVMQNSNLQWGPMVDGLANQVLTTNGLGGLSWTTPSAGSGTLVAYGQISSPTFILDGVATDITTTWSINNQGGKWTSGGTNHITVQTGGAGVYEVSCNFTWFPTSTINAGSITSRFSVNAVPFGLMEEKLTKSTYGDRWSGSMTNTFITSLNVGDILKGQLLQTGTGVSFEITNWHMTVKFLY
jgi:hypothetical protein